MVQIFVDFRWKCEESHIRNCRCDYLASVFASCFPMVSDKINGILGFPSHFPKQMLHFPSAKRGCPSHGRVSKTRSKGAAPSFISGPRAEFWKLDLSKPRSRSPKSPKSPRPRNSRRRKAKRKKDGAQNEETRLCWRWFVSFSQYPMGNPLRVFFCGIVFLCFFVFGVLRISKSKETHGNKKTAMSSHADSWFLLIWDRHRPKCRLNDRSGSARSPSSCAAIVRHRDLHSSAVKFDVGTERELDGFLCDLHYWLVVWNMNYIVPFGWRISPPQLTHIFQRGRYTTNQSLIYGECKNGVHNGFHDGLTILTLTILTCNTNDSFAKLDELQQPATSLEW